MYQNMDIYLLEFKKMQVLQD